MRLFGLSQTAGFTQRLAQQLRMPVAPHEEREFADGEFKIRPLESVRGQHVVVCQSLAADRRMSCADKLLRLLVFCGALKDAGAGCLTAVVPYLAYWRKDRRTQPSDPVTTSYLARLVEAVGVDAVVTIDAHNVATFENAFRCRKEHLQAAPVFAEHMARRLPSQERIVVLAPDAGGEHRAREFAALLAERAGRGVELAFMEKRRSLGRVSGELFAGEVEGAAVVIYDDMISTGETVARAVRAAAARGARAVHCAATHGLFSGEAVATLNAVPLTSLAISDTVEDVAERCAQLRCEHVVVDSGAVFAAALAAAPPEG
jgi:ribose-phosphate pyrophosphokinase